MCGMRAFAARTQKGYARMEPHGGRKMHGTILLADDEEMVLHVFKAMLEHLGYSVVCGRNGVEALRIFREDPDAIDVVLTDYYMPEMSGADLARSIRRLGSDVPIVLITGLGFDLPGGLISSINIARMVMKPIDMHSMAEIIQQALDSRAGNRLKTNARI
jgi:CheY-like chemotaxis protein